MEFIKEIHNYLSEDIAAMNKVIVDSLATDEELIQLVSNNLLQPLILLNKKIPVSDSTKLQTMLEFKARSADDLAWVKTLMEHHKLKEGIFA